MSYVELFTSRARADRRGRATRWEASTAIPRLERLFSAYIRIETAVIGGLDLELERVGLTKDN